MRALLPLCLTLAPLLGAADPEPGIPEALARSRVNRISDLRYRLHLDLPESQTAPISGRMEVSARLKPGKGPLVLDFDAGVDAVKAVRVGGQNVAWRLVNGHLEVPTPASGQVQVGIDFVAGSGPLNRQPDFLYSLFVPARAHRAIPCFDQPDLKARYTLSLGVPGAWVALSNGAEVASEVQAGRQTLRFAETQPLPTYLFAFAAGRFQVETAVRAGRTYRLFHRETDPERFKRNREAIFDLHASALAWLEKDTAYPYPFGKFDFIAIPSFQFGGMEHPGAIYYRASSLFLEAGATRNEQMGRASLISHETAHLWYGDLVTMRWFSDVWMKEVFAGLMADKIVEPSYPEMNHQLAFLYGHYPAAYSVDRTLGSNPIRQELSNLADAGSLYGSIIYDKAPIAMRNLEALVGPAAFQKATREYLRTFAFGNADWSDLIAILNRQSSQDVVGWNRAWVERKGRPLVETVLELRNGRIVRLAFRQTDPLGRGMRWPQRLKVVVGFPGGPKTFELDLKGAETEVRAARGLAAPSYVLPVGQGLGYGHFALDAATLAHLVAHLPEIQDPLTRGAAWVALWECHLDAKVPSSHILELALKALPRETDDLSLDFLLGRLQDVFWRHLAPDERTLWAARLEAALQQHLARVASASQKRACFQALRDLTMTPDGLARLERLWRRQTQVEGLTLSDRDLRRVAQILALHEVAGWKGILAEELGRIPEPDEKARFAYLMPALDADPAARRAWFESLRQLPNRSREAWVQEGMRFLHHPLRAAVSRPLVKPGLEMLEEIRRTGDIFFPQGWTRAILGGQSGIEVVADVKTVRDALSIPALRRTLDISLDGLERAVQIQANHVDATKNHH